MQASRVPWDNRADPPPFHGLLCEQHIPFFVLTPIYNCIQLQRLCVTPSVSARGQGSGHIGLSSLLLRLMTAQDRPDQLCSSCIVCSPYGFNGSRFNELLQLQSVVLDCWPAMRSHPEQKGTLVRGLSYTWPLTKNHNACACAQGDSYCKGQKPLYFSAFPARTQCQFSELFRNRLLLLSTIFSLK